MSNIPPTRNPTIALNEDPQPPPHPPLHTPPVQAGQTRTFSALTPSPQVHRHTQRPQIASVSPLSPTAVWQRQVLSPTGSAMSLDDFVIADLTTLFGDVNNSLGHQNPNPPSYWYFVPRVK